MAKNRLFLSVFIVISMVVSVKALTDKYRCMWRDDPSTTMVIGWNQVSGTAPVVYYDVSDRGEVINKYAFLKKADRIIAFRDMNNYFVRLTNLQPNTFYYFIIKDSEGLSRRMYFKTAPDRPDTRISIIAGGDSRNNVVARKSSNKLVSKLKPLCVLFNGDMTDGDTGKEWQSWLDDWQLTIGSDGRITPVLVARGNHESSNETLFNLFDLPSENVYYSFGFGGNLVRLYTLNSLIPVGGDQKAWLQRDLEGSSNYIWKIAQYHYPMRPHTKSKEEQDEQVIHWASLFQKYQVCLGMESDAHVVKSTFPIRPSSEAGSYEGFIRDDVQGTVYVGEGGWGAPLRRNDDDKPWTRASASFNHFEWIFLDQERIEVRIIRTDNADKVAELPKENVFMIPANLEVWKPSNGNGDVIMIRKKSSGSYDDLLASRGSLKVVSFSTITNGGDIAIKWKSVNEQDGHVYEVQKSVDGETYTALTQQKAKGGGENSYAILDKGAAAQNEGKYVSYRLKLLFPSGETGIYDPQDDGNETESWRILPKLSVDALGVLKVKYTLDAPGDVVIRLLNLRLRQMQQDEQRGQKPGTYVRSLDMAKLPDGRYLVIIRTNQRVLQRYQVMKN